jgi:hypothetical protein
MSTRTAIIFIGSNGQAATAVRLYQHHDGYPSNVLPTIKATLKAVRKKAAEHAHTMAYRNAGEKFDFLTTPLHAGLLAGAYIFEETSGFGMGAELESSMYIETDDYQQFDAETAKRVFGDHGDLEWLYLVNAVDRSVRVFSGGQEWPADMVAAGMVDPMEYVECIVDDYQERTAAQIRSACRSLSRAGFPVNPKRLSGRRAAHAAQRAKLRV